MKPNKEYLEAFRQKFKHSQFVDYAKIEAHLMAALEEKDREWEKQIETIIEQEAEFINLNGMEVTVIELAKLRKALGIKAAKQE